MSSIAKAPDGPITVLIVEDQTAIRNLLASFVAAMPSFKVVGEAGSVPDALRLAEEHKPRVVVLDWMLLNGLGLEFLNEVRIDPPPHVLVFSANITELAVREALGAGARGYIEKTASFTEFTAALKTVAEGETYLGKAAARALNKPANQTPVGFASTELSPRERDVLRFLAEGMSSKEIGECLGLSVRTVENHRASIMRRTGLKSVAQLTLHAVRLGLVELGGAPHETQSA